MDTALMANLKKALEYEAMLVENMLSVGHEKTELLVHNKPLEIHALMAKEQQLAEQMGQLEKVRMQLNAKAAEQLGMTEPNPTLGQLCEFLGEEKAGDLQALHNQLVRSVRALQALNGLNAELIQQSLEFVNFNLQLLVRPAASVPRYGRGGRDLSDTAPARSVMDLRS